MPDSTERFHVVTSRNVIAGVFEGHEAQKRAESYLKHPGWKVLRVITTTEDVTPSTVEA